MALKTYQGRILAHATAIHATSEAEAENLRCLPCVRSPIFVIPNAVDGPRPVPGDVCMRGRKVLLFLSRLHEKKGLDLLLQAWNQVRPSDWRLLIVGSGETAYVERLKRFCATEQIPDVEFHAHVDGDAREATFARASALVLPTYSENFGNVVAEALIRGLPVMNDHRHALVRDRRAELRLVHRTDRRAVVSGARRTVYHGPDRPGGHGRARAAVRGGEFIDFRGPSASARHVQQCDSLPKRHHGRSAEQVVDAGGQIIVGGVGQFRVASAQCMAAAHQEAATDTGGTSRLDIR